MAQHAQKIITVINNLVVDDDDTFSDGFCNGYLHYYDANCQLPRPLTCRSIYSFMKENLADSCRNEHWNAGFVFGWIAALSENEADGFFTSIVLPEVLPEPHVLFRQI